FRLDDTAPPEVQAAAAAAICRQDKTAAPAEGQDGVLDALLAPAVVRQLVFAHPAIRLADVPPDYSPRFSGQTPGPLPRLFIIPPTVDSPVLCVLDTGVDDHPYLRGVIEAAEWAGYLDRGDDEDGHGTFVSALAAYGPDLRSGLAGRVLHPTH